MPTPPLAIPPQRIEDFCRKWRAKEFAVFGSVRREDFRPDSAFQNAHPQVPWQKIVAQRHILAHEYGEIESDLI